MHNILVNMREAGMVTDEARQAVERLCAEGVPLDAALVQASGVPEEKLLAYLASQFGLPYTDLETWEPPDGLLARFPARVLL
jgi:hypothetical protein